MKEFKELGLKSEILKALDEIGFVEPFPIQAEAIPILLEGRDVVGQAHTGTGKTAAFALPLLQNIDPGVPVQALILVPTRELAVQVATEIKKFAKYIPVRTVTIYGGQSINLQFQALNRGRNIIVATPGRLIDHVKRGSISLNNVKFVVLDEADKMFDMGFVEDIKFILDLLPENKQVCLFSATMPSEIFGITERYMNRPEKVLIDSEELSVDTIEQSYLIVDGREKFEHLCNQLSRKKTQTIVFCATKQRTRKLVRDLQQRGFRANAIHGDLPQSKRDNVMYRFRKGLDDILVATDLAARGIDVPQVGHVINYDVPNDPLVYFHRIGRTARAGASGVAFTLVSDVDRDAFQRILARTEVPIKRMNEDLGIEIKAYVPRRNYGSTRNNRNRFYKQRRSFQKNYYGLQSRW
ncbi:MAG: DEAD/DEAH box helicase [Nitrososphaerales archaeon]